MTNKKTPERFLDSLAGAHMHLMIYFGGLHEFFKSHEASILSIPEYATREWESAYTNHSVAQADSPGAESTPNSSLWPPPPKESRVSGGERNDKQLMAP